MVQIFKISNNFYRGMSENSSTDKIFSGSIDSFACGMRSVRDMRSTVDEKKKKKKKKIQGYAEFATKSRHD